MNLTRRLRTYVMIAFAGFLAFSSANIVRAQTSPDLTSLRQQLGARYDIVALQNGLGLVPHQRNSAIRLIEIRNGGVVINGDAVTAREARERLGPDADLILRLTYLDAAAQRELARADSSGTASRAGAQENTSEPESTSPARTQIHRGDLVRIGGDVTVGRDEVVQGDVVVVGGSADIDGEVTREVAVIGGPLNLGPEAVVRGDVAVVGGSLTRSPTARIYGKVDEVGVGGHRWGRRIRHQFPSGMPSFRMGGLVGTLVRVTLLILGTLVVVAVGRRFVETIADRAAAEPFRSGVTGLLAEVLFVPSVLITIVVLAVSIIGIPLLLLVPFGIVLAVVPMLVGFTAVAYLIGRLLSHRFGIERGPYFSVLLGVLIVVTITLVARIAGLAGGFVPGVVVARLLAVVGGLAEYVAWTIGIGAVILTWLSTRRRGTSTAAVAPPAAGSTT